MGRRFLVTGASGFIGSNLCRRLCADAHAVRALVRRTSRLDFLQGVPIEIAIGDVTDAASIDDAMRGVEIVVHVAGLASDWGPCVAFERCNVQGTRNVLVSAKSHGVSRVVHISSVAVHGFPGFRNATEDAPMPRTIWPYCQTKKQAEIEAMEFGRREGLEVVAIRPGNVYGPNDHTFFEKYADAMTGGKGGYIRRGRSWTCPTYVENLVEAIVLACFEPRAAGEAFLITDGAEIDWRTFTEKIADALGIVRPRLSLPFWLGYGAATAMEWTYKLLRIGSPPLLTRYRICNGGRDYHFSIEKARRMLGYRPPIGLDEAIRRTAQWYLHRRAKAEAVAAG